MASHAGAHVDNVATFASSQENRLIACADRGIRGAADLYPPHGDRVQLGRSSRALTNPLAA